MANRTSRLDLRTILASIATPVRTVRIEQNGSASKKNGTGVNRTLCVFVSFYVEGLHVAIFIRARFS